MLNRLANSEDPDEMRHNAAFHRGLHCLVIQNQSSVKKMYVCMYVCIYIYIYIYIYI